MAFTVKRNISAIIYNQFSIASSVELPGIVPSCFKLFSTTPPSSGDANPPEQGRLWRNWIEGKLDELKTVEEQPTVSKTTEQKIIDIIAPPSPHVHQLPKQGYAALGQAQDAPNPYPTVNAKADEMSPQRIHPHRLFYPMQLYSPVDLNPYKQKPIEVTQNFSSRMRSCPVTPSKAISLADYRNVGFLHEFLSVTGQLPAKRHTQLQSKLHRHLCRQIKIARQMGLISPDGSSKEKWMAKQRGARRKQRV